MGQGNRSKATRQGEPGFTGRFIVDTWRGQPRIRAWPRKRGKVKSADQKVQTDWFRHVQQQWNKIPAIQQLSFMKATAGSGLYPRDLFMKAKAGTMLPIRLPDGRILTGRQLRIEPVTWQGFMLRLSANQVVGTGGGKRPTWPTPILQTAPFWDAGAPTGITVPQGVEIMNFEASFRLVGGGNADDANTIFNVTTSFNYVVVFVRTPGTGGVYCATGPILVTPGDFIVNQLALATSGTLEANDTWFSGTILQGA